MMKKYLIATTLLLTLGLTNAPDADAQKHRHHPVAATAATPDDTTPQDEVEAFSDTTDVDTTSQVVYQTGSSSYSYSFDISDEDFVKTLMSEFGGKELAGVVMVLGVLFLLFVLAPVLILFVIFYFIWKNRKERMRLAEAAMQNGQPIPAQLVEEGDTIRKRGIRQAFLGVGLMVFLGYSAGTVGFGIGVLVTCIGIGNLVIARTSGNGN